MAHLFIHIEMKMLTLWYLINYVQHNPHIFILINHAPPPFFHLPLFLDELISLKLPVA